MSRNTGIPERARKEFVPPVKMSTEEAERTWNGMTYQQKVEFARMYQKLVNGELRLAHVNVDENERVQNIELVGMKKPEKDS